MKKNLSTFLLILVFLVGLSVMLYPTVSDTVNRAHQTRAVVDYEHSVQGMEEKDYTAWFQKAEEYNALLASDPEALYRPDTLPDYASTLDVTGTGIMGYLSIPRLNVSLPIYHGTGESVLQIAVGHLEGSSFPIGGQSTHAVLSAHRGLPSAKLFTDLDKLEPGDTFEVTVLNRVLTYEVDNISIVLPQEAEGLLVQPGKDYLTLMTCTPYGINSHRLLVRGRRIENGERLHKVNVVSEAVKVDPLLIAPILAAPLLLVLLIWLIWPGKQKKKGGMPNEEYP